MYIIKIKGQLVRFIDSVINNIYQRRIKIDFFAYVLALGDDRGHCDQRTGCAQVNIHDLSYLKKNFI